jgi:predicted MPP superfamily phosphohydrolase
MSRRPLRSTLAHPALRSLAALATAGLACVAYGVLVERRWYRVRRYLVAVLPPGSSPLTVLHLSDLHVRARDPSKVRFLASLPAPDLAVVTGDILGEPEAVETAVAALRPLRGRLGSLFVLGSNDYFVPRPLNYAAYFRRRRPRRRGVRNRSDELVRLLEADGWVHLRNRRLSLSADGTRLEVLGLDDPHIERHDLRSAPREDPLAVGVAVVHAPDPAPELASLGYELILAGHTHGGQVRLPLVGALVTNSTVPRRLAMGLARVGPAVLHVSPGLGTSKYAPFRFLCRPEATVLELLARPPGQGGSAGLPTASS